jgi:polyphenol oxidase
MFLRSPKLASVAHGFPTRQGGVSTGRFASLNLLAKWGDDPAHVAENRRRLADAAGFELERLFTVQQVHGAAVVTVRAGDEPTTIAAHQADALVTDVAGVALGVGTADCVPVLIADGAGRIAAAHAGWRGTVADVVAAAVEALVALGARRERLRGALGPSICAACFEVGPEVADAFVHLPGVVDRSRPRAHVDLRLANRLLLERAGLSTEAIDDRPPCTMCEPERFFSYRRDGAGIGQHLSFIVSTRSA